MKVKGSLTEAMWKLEGNVALLVIDEKHDLTKKSESESNETRIAQLKVYAVAKEKKFFKVLVKFTMGYSMVESDVTMGYDFEYGKPNANAFKSDSQELLMFLRSKKVATLIVVGYHINACVRATIGASAFNLSDARGEEGAVQNGFKVLTCRQVLRGDKEKEDPDITWNLDHENLAFYATD